MSSALAKLSTAVGPLDTGFELTHQPVCTTFRRPQELLEVLTFRGSSHHGRANPTNRDDLVVDRLQPDDLQSTSHRRQLEDSRITDSFADESDTDRRRHRDVAFLELD